MNTAPTPSDKLVGLFTWTFPSVTILCLGNILAHDSILFVSRVIGNRIPTIARSTMSFTFSAWNAALAIVGLGFLNINCKIGLDVCNINPLKHLDCSKTVAIELVVLFVLSMVDRIVLIFLYANHRTSFLTRMGECGSIVIAWQLLGERESLAPVFLSLLVAQRLRFLLPQSSKYAGWLFRTALGCYSILALGKNCNTTSQKAAVGIALCLVLSSSKCPKARDPQAHAKAQHAPQAKRRRSRAALPEPLTLSHQSSHALTRRMTALASLRKEMQQTGQ